MKLGGWHRLWFLLSALYLAVVAVVAALSLPQVESTPHRTEFYERMDRQSIADIVSVPDTKEITRVRMPNGHKIPFPSSMPPARMREVGEGYLDIVRDQDRLSYIGKAALIWIIPVLAAYILGTAVGWVYKGFKGR